VLADDTYRMGFRAITAGRFLAAKLSAEYGMAADAARAGIRVLRYKIARKSRLWLGTAPADDFNVAAKAA
jgi:O-antigen biosynthesis protein